MNRRARHAIWADSIRPATTPCNHPSGNVMRFEAGQAHGPA